MKTLLTALSVLTIGLTTGNLSSALNIISQKTDTADSYIKNKTQQDTIYIDKDRKQQTTSARDLSNLATTEIIQIGFYKNTNREIQVIRMPKTVLKVPTRLPQEITSLSLMFAGASSFNQDLSNWDVSKITNMSFMFNGAVSFNGNISNWDVSNVTNMFVMFAGASSFNQDISDWKTSNVTVLSLMFYNASLFNQDLSRWDVSNVTNMSFMFYNASSFNQDLSKWDVSKVTSHINFSTGSGITNPNKLPKFKN